jgi:hypothetical protein
MFLFPGAVTTYLQTTRQNTISTIDCTKKERDYKNAKKKDVDGVMKTDERKCGGCGRNSKEKENIPNIFSILPKRFCSISIY